MVTLQTNALLKIVRPDWVIDTDIGPSGLREKEGYKIKLSYANKQHKNALYPLFMILRTLDSTPPFCFLFLLSFVRFWKTPKTP